MRVRWGKWQKIVGCFAALFGILYLLGDHHAPDVTHARVDKPLEKLF